MQDTSSIYNQLILSKNSIHIVPAAIISLIIIISALYINRLTQKAIISLGIKHNLEQTLVKAIQNLAYVFIYAVAITLFLENLHIHMSAIFGTLGVVAIGAGFALQQALANMTSGMFLLFYKPFFVGDHISCDSENIKFEGTIIDISLRMTTLEHNGTYVCIPNQTLYTAVVIVKKNPKNNS